MQGEGGRKGERESREGGASEGGVRKGTLQWAREGKRERDTGTPSRKMKRGEEWIVERGGGKREGTFTPLVIAELSSLPSQYNYLYNTKM